MHSDRDDDAASERVALYKFNEHYEEPHRERYGSVKSFWKTRAGCLTLTIIALCICNVLQFLASSGTSLPNARLHDGVKEVSIDSEDSTASGRDVPDKAVVLASYYGQDLAWTSTLATDWQLYRYILDDSRPFVPSSPVPRNNVSRSEAINNYTYTVPRNQGREAMAYLTYIIDNYDALPFFTIFLHGHDTAWHQIEHAADKVRALNLTTLALDGYLNIRCSQQNRCRPDKIWNLNNATAWKHGNLQVLPKYWDMMFPNQPRPDKLAAAESAQFAVSRDAILARPLSFWKAVRRPLERDIGDYKEQLHGIKDNYGWGLVYEHLWHVIFGKEAFHCIDEEYCHKTLFCDAITCDRYVEFFGDDKDDWEKIKCRTDEAAMGRAKEEQDMATKATKEKMLHES